MTPKPTNDVRTPKSQGRGIRQTMSDLHTWAGLLVGWLLYAMFLTGTVSYFKDEISQWMRPEVPHRQTLPDPAIVAQNVANRLTTLAAGSPQWSIYLPTERNPVAGVFWRNAPAPKGSASAPRRTFEEATFDPTTGETLKARETLGGDFFYRFHFQFHPLPVMWGRWLAGFCAMFMLVAIVSGVITHKKIFIDFFTFRWGKGQRSWLDAHNALSVFGLPFHLMITYTGLVTLMAMYMPWGAQTAIKTPVERSQLNAQLSAFPPPGKATGEKMPLASIEAMVREAQARWGARDVGRVTVTNAGDANARVAVTRGESTRVSMSPQYLLFEGATGKLIDVHDNVGAAAETRGVMYALHLGRFSDLHLRWLYFLVSLGGTAMVGTGLVMWTVKRRSKLPDPARPHFGFHVVERLNIAAIAGLSIAMTAFLWSNRLIPADALKRSATEVDAFYWVWAATLLYALVRPAKRAWIELLWAGAAVLALLPIVNAVTTSRGFWHSVTTGDWVYAGVDAMLWAFAALHAWLAVRTARHKPKTKPARRADVAKAAPPAINAPLSEDRA
ncbi:MULTISPECIES: PepSY-associated TM helix domain-containing protein [Pandoraea]|uniref:PepSY-associated TM helix domain-containing protein n=1 Tax=Pandoraea TaxID=93217 RepID=UPI001F5E2A5D|nr:MULTISPECIES: PepSY-associated TM helix domain-containing protein [Pandoraea]MCI3205943.1 PepSY domain-containing protein [Pandoraea sp. LA3]MDN4583971.1 PepSY domain-containing protein [Pandoraea capi]